MSHSRHFHCVVVLLLVCVVFLRPAAAEELSLSFTLESKDVSLKNKDGKLTVSLDAERTCVLEEIGLPELPYSVVNVVLPQGQIVQSARFNGEGEIVLARGVEVRLAERAENAPAVAVQEVPLVGENGGEFPGLTGKYLGTGYLHGYAIASFAVFPLRMRNGDLILTGSIRIDVTTAPGDPGYDVVSRKRHVAGFRTNVRELLGSFTVNGEQADVYAFDEITVEKKAGGFKPTSFPSLEGSPVEYVIITNDSMASAYEPLAEWKTAKGVPTVIRTTEWIEANYRNGSDIQETIRNFIKEAYANWAITYVLLGGDNGQIPARFGASFYAGDKELPVDMYFACLDGDWNADHDEYFGEGGMTDGTDLYPEVYVGRLPTNTVSQVNLLVDKIIQYESSTNPTYTNKVLFLAEVLFPIDWQYPDPIAMNGAGFAENIFYDSMTDPDVFVTRMYQTDYLYPGSVNENKAAALDSLNSGYNHAVHIGHGFRFNMSVGDASIVNSDIDVLTNGNRYTNAYLLNCTAVAFTYFCLAEHMMLAPNGGAVSVIGANESAFPYQSNLIMYEYYKLLFSKDVLHIGETFARSRLPYVPVAGLYDNAYLWTFYIYTFLGDPEMLLWNDVVEVLQVSHPANVTLGTSTIEVTVETGGFPQDSVLVCLSKGEDDYQYGLTDALGNVTFDFRAESPGQIRVVATGKNYVRYEGTITVDGSAGAYVNLNDVTVDDDNVGGTTGNGDGVIDAGETVDLLLRVVNTGGTASGNVTLKLWSGDGNVVVTDSLASVGVVPGGGGSVWASDPVRIQFSPDIADEAAVDFALVLREDGIDEWGDTFSRVVHAPVLELAGLRVDDSLLGNGNGIVNDYEWFDLFYGIKNFGTGTAYGLSAVLEDLEDGFVFTDSTDVYAPIPPQAAVENVNGLFMQEWHVIDEKPLKITITDAYGRIYEKTFELRPPQPPTNVTSDPKLGPDRLLLSWDASVSADVARYNVYKSDAPGGPYVRINNDPVDHTVFLNQGLLPSWRYYYVITSLDGSGNESVFSAEYSGSTNPEQIDGWPIRMLWETTSSPAIGDIDGDGDLEIVQGNQKVYAWHHDGLEMVDGDENAQTWGLLTTVGDQFVSPVALAAIDAVPGLDIIAASRNTKEVYVFDYNGEVVPGWPQPVLNLIRAGIVVGDLDGDGLREVVAVDEKGVVYAWNTDGSEFRDGDANPATHGVLLRMQGSVFHYSTPALADLDDDSMDEIILGTESDSLYVFNGDGTLLPGWPVGLGADVSGSPAVGDIDDNGDLEIVVNTIGGGVRALHHTGATLWSKWFPNNVAFGPSPALGDLNGDGKLETLIPSSNLKLYAITYTGAYLPNWPVTYNNELYTESSPVIGDMNGDGNPDVVLGDETRYIHAWDVNGDPLDGFPLATEDALRAVPAIDDIDGDGDVDLVASGWDKTIYVWDFPSTYHETTCYWPNFHANSHNNGLVGFAVPTGIAEVTFAYEFRGSGVELSWILPASAGYLFDVKRAVLEGQERDIQDHEFKTVAADVPVDADGVLRYLDSDVEMGTRYVYRMTSADHPEINHTTGVVYVRVTRVSLEQNYPNPFNPVTRISFFVPDGQTRHVSLIVYDVKGARVKTLANEIRRGGKHTVEWDGRNDAGGRVASGVYFYRLVEGSFSDTKKMLLLK